MVIPSLGLKDFRNYQEFQISFSEGIQFISGNNGQGKTNLIEAIYLATHLRSYRSQRLRPLIRQGTDEARVFCRFNNQGVSHQVQLELWPQAKKVLVDQKPLHYSSEYIQRFFSILFAPDQLARYKEYPAERRSYFDRALCLLEPGYFTRLKEYEQVKAQKNQLLRDRRFKELSYFNPLMAQAIVPLVRARKTLAAALNQELPNLHQLFSQSAEPLQLIYKADCDDTEVEGVLEKLWVKSPQEEAQGFVGVGPHKDNYLMTMGPKMDRVGFSQGEYRIAFLALLFGLNIIFGKQLNSRPLLLLDDLFSELDPQVSGALLELLRDLNNQVFITSTRVPQGYTAHATEYRIEDANLA